MRRETFDGQFSSTSWGYILVGWAPFLFGTRCVYVLHDPRHFNVGKLFLWDYSRMFEAEHQDMICSNYYNVLAAVHRFDHDGVAINFNQYHVVLVTPLGSL